MDYTTQRGILQLVIGVCCACFAAGMFVRSWRRDEHGWPLPWRTVVALWIASLAWSYLAHGYRWLQHEDLGFDDWRMVAPLYAVCGMSLWTFFRWWRDARTDEH
jgi:hypothetical protein